MGGIHEPLRLSFQGDYFHSGSISFGRYETEALCWERRSSFSHNRYLEEVERCSTPGLVTEKKAYFEAHFKRKALLSKIKLECQSGSDSQNIRNGVNLQNISDDDNKIEHLDEEIHKTSWDKNLPDQSHITKYGSGCSGCLGADNEHPYHTLSMDEKMVHKEFKIEEAETGCEAGLIRCEPKNEEKEILTGCSEAETSKKSSKSATKVKTWSGISKLVASKLSVVKAKRSDSILSSKDSVIKPVNKECHTSSRSKRDTAATMMCSVSGTLKTPTSCSPKTRVHENKSFLLAKISTLRSTVNSRPSTPERVGQRAHQTANRNMKIVNSTTPIMKQNGSAFSFIRDHHSERRKELEEKMLANETKAQQFKDKKQVISPLKEKVESDMKQLRKSSNFKATPMPSFYTEARRSLDRGKGVDDNYKTSKIQNKQSSPGAGSFRRSLSSQSMRSHQACSTNEYQNNNSIQVSSDNKRNEVSKQAAADKPLISKHGHKEVKNESVLNHGVIPSFYTEARRSLDRSKVGAANYKTTNIQNKPSSPGAGSLKRSLSFQSMRSHEACSTKGYRYINSVKVSSDSQAAADKPLISEHGHIKVNSESVLNHGVLENKQVSKGRKTEGVHKMGDATRTKGILRSKMGSLAVGVA